MKFAYFSQLYNKPGLTGYPRYEQLWRELELADELGFDFAFQTDHHFFKVRPSPAMFCTGGALRTKRIRLGPLGYTAGLMDPIRIVEEVTVLDNMTNGRLEVGMAAGVYPDYWRLYGADVANRRDLVQDAILLLKAAFATEGEFSFAGRFRQYEDVELALKPIQKPHPPMWLPSSDPGTLAFNAREGVNTAYIHLMDHQEITPRMREYLRLWQEAGHQDPPNIGYATYLYVDETDEAALAKGIEPILFSLNEFNRNPKRGGVDAEGEKLGARTHETYRNLENVDYLLNHNIVYVGSPETVVNRIKAAAKEGFFNTLIAEFNVGALPEEDLMRSIRLFGTQVMPTLRELDPTNSVH